MPKIPSSPPPQSPPKIWQLVFAAEKFHLGVCCDEDVVISTAYLPRTTRARAAQNMLAAECANQLQTYFQNPRRHQFRLPFMPAKTAFQTRVRDIVFNIPAGKTLRYGDIAAKLKNSSPRAVGGACRANDIPLFIPCHRVVAAGNIGGFMGDGGHHALNIKSWLLQHEGVL